MKTFYTRVILPVTCILIVLSCSCTQPEKTINVIQEKPAVVETKPLLVEEKPLLVEEKPPADEPSNIVAKIDDYTISGQELNKRILQKLKEEPEPYVTEIEQTDAQKTLLEMIAEKAMIMDARENNLLQEEMTQSIIERFREKKLVGSLITKYLQDKITVTEQETEQLMKSNPKLNQQRAEAMLKKNKSAKLVDEYYQQLYENANVKKFPENYQKVIQTYRGLLLNARKKYKLVFVRIEQINQLPPEKKNIILATFNNGKITLKDWFDTLTNFSPPSRPRDLHTPEGIEKLLDRSLKAPILVAEAETQGLHKDKSFLKELRDYEDRNLLGQAQREKTKNIKSPEDEAVLKKYFQQHIEDFKSPPDRMKTDQIFFEDLKTARQAKKEVDAGADFQTVKQKYSLNKKLEPINSDLDREKMFFRQIWKAEPNDVVGPIKGVYYNDVKWRLIKILEKIPGKVKEYSEEMKNVAGYKIEYEKRQAALEEYRKNLLKKYPYTIYKERIKNFDPLNID